MSTITLRHAAAMFAACCLALQAVAQPAILAKARAYLGSESTLNAVTSLHFTGTLTIEGANQESGQPQPKVALDIIFQKPDRHRSMITSDARVEITVLDGYDGWQKVEDPKDPNRWTMNLLNPEQIKSLRANVIENLSFYGGLDSRRVTVEDQGAATINGVACRKVAFIHSPQIAFYRYFDEATGQLVLTETQQGESIREEGSVVVDGIRFPKALITTAKRPDGSTQAVTIHFEKVVLNETLDKSVFAVPSMGAR